MQSVSFNVLDELFFHLERRDDPFALHHELRVQGHLDADKLLAAIHRAAALHPMARAFMLPWQPSDREYRWGIADSLAMNPLQTVLARDPGEVRKARADFMSQSVPLHAAPPFRCLLIQHEEGDYFLVNMNHAACDSLGLARFVRSIVRAYAGEADPQPAVDPLKQRNLSKLFGAPTLAERLRRFAPLAQYLLESLKPPSRIATDGGIDMPGFGFELLRMSEDESVRLQAVRESKITINDLLIAALHSTIAQWNEQHGEKAGRITVMMPISLRPAEWQHEVVGNYSVFVPVGTQAEERSSFAQTLAMVSRWTAWYKQTRGSSQLIELLRGAPWLPLWLKRASRDLISLTGNRVVDSSALSNLGRFDDLGSFGGRSGKITELWFSPPARMPLGVAVGAVTIKNSLHLTFRYRKAQFGPEAAARFAALYKAVLLGER